MGRGKHIHVLQSFITSCENIEKTVPNKEEVPSEFKCLCGNKMCLALTLEAMLLATMSYHLSIWQNLFERMCN